MNIIVHFIFIFILRQAINTLVTNTILVAINNLNNMLMKKITEKFIYAIAYIIAKFDSYLYHDFGYISRMRRQIWQRNAIKLQIALDREHRLTDAYNKLNGTDYCTKRVMKEIGIEEVN